MTFLQERQKNIYKFTIFFILWILLGFLWAFFYFKQSFLHSNSLLESQKQENSTITLQLFNNVKTHKVFRLFSNNFYGFEQKTQKELEDNFIKSLVGAFGDKYSEYFDEKWMEEFSINLNGNFQWIGAVVSEHPLGAKIDRVIEGSPAEKSWLLMWDIVVSADGVNLWGKTTSESVDLIRGDKGTVVKIEYMREWERNQVDVTRDEVYLPSVDGKMLEDSDIGYIQVNSFADKTPQEMQKFMSSLTSSGAKSFILDFRFNGGGYLDSAQTMLSSFFPKNTPIAIVKENDPRKNQILYTEESIYKYHSTPIVVLVNELSASASEIFAGAIADHNRGIIVGKKTYGKWSVQEMFPLWDGTMVKLTVAKWYTPKDKNIDEQGIVPDIDIDFKAEDYKNSFDRQLDIAKKVLQEMVSGKNKDEIIANFSNN